MKYLALVLSFVLLLISCESNSVEDLIEISVNDFSTTIDENPINGSLIGNLGATITSGSLSYSIANQNPGGAVEVSSNGDLLVLNATLFDFENNPEISGQIDVRSGDNSVVTSFLISLNDIDETVLSVQNFTGSVLRTANNGDTIGQVSAAGPMPITYALDNLNIEAVEIDNQGFITLSDVSLLEANTTITGNIVVNDGVSSASAELTINVQAFNIWSGSTITFTKSGGADPTLEENQDRITENVWITRGNNGGQIYNAKVESSANSSSSPAGTEWAIGAIEDISSLSFDTFRNTIKPKNVVGVNLILHLIQDDIYIPVTFTSWSQNKNGGFGYERATE